MISHHSNRTSLEDELEIFKKVYTASLNEIKKTKRELEANLAGFDVISEENKKLHRKYKALSKEFSTVSKQRNQQREQLKQKNFDTRMKMDEILRSTIKEFDKDYQREAVAFIVILHHIYLTKFKQYF